MNGALSKEIEWQQNEQELVLELDGDFFGRNMKCVGARISEGTHVGSTRHGGAPSGVGRALHPRGHMVAPLVCSQCQ